MEIPSRAVTRRAFNRIERTAIYVGANGKCAMCGAELGPDWEADHFIPFTQGGETDVANGQALCRACNRRKGSTYDG